MLAANPYYVSLSFSLIWTISGHSLFCTCISFSNPRYIYIYIWVWVRLWIWVRSISYPHLKTSSFPMISPSSSLLSPDPLLMQSPKSSGNIFSALLSMTVNSSMTNAQSGIEEIQNIQQHVTKPSSKNDKISSVQNINLFDKLSPKRSYLSSDSSVSTLKSKPTKKIKEKYTKYSPSNLIEKIFF